MATKNGTVNVLYYPSEVTKSSRVFSNQNEISHCKKSLPKLVAVESLFGRQGKKHIPSNKCRNK